jgi:hypothetical protein
MLPKNFPTEPPAIAPLDHVFHPNISEDRVDLLIAWKPSVSIAQCVWTLAQMVAFQIWDGSRALNGRAAAWVEANPDSVPTYAGALAPAATMVTDSETSASSVLDDIRDGLDVFVDRLLQPGHTVDGYEVVTAAQSIRERLRPFLEQPDADTEVREMDDLARALPQAVEALATVRRVRSRTAKSAKLLQSLLAQERLITQLVRWFDRHAKSMPGANPMDELLTVPELADRAVQELRTAVGDAQKLADALRAVIDELTRPPVVRTSSPLLNRRIASELDTMASTWTMRNRRMRDALSRVDGELAVVRGELPTLQRVADGRRLLSELDTIDAVVREIADTSNLIQTYTMRTAAGTFGPFGFEMPVEYGTWRLALRRTSPEQIDIVIADTCQVLASFAPNQVFTLELASEDSLESEFVEFHIRPDALSVQISVADHVDRIRRLVSAVESAIDPSGRFERFARALLQPEVIRPLRGAHDSGESRWALVLDELAKLSEIRTRQATRQLLLRAIDALSQRWQARSQVGTLMKDVDARLARIVSRSTRPDTHGEVVLRARDAHEYQSLLARRSELEAQFHETDALFAAWAAVLRPVVQEPLAETFATEFVLLAPPVSTEEMTDLSNESIDQMIVQIRGMLPDGSLEPS